MLPLRRSPFPFLGISFWLPPFFFFKHSHKNLEFGALPTAIFAYLSSHLAPHVAEHYCQHKRGRTGKQAQQGPDQQAPQTTSCARSQQQHSPQHRATMQLQVAKASENRRSPNSPVLLQQCSFSFCLAPLLGFDPPYQPTRDVP